MDIIFPNTAKTGTGFSDFLNKTLGIKSRRVGTDILISSKDAGRGFGPRKFLTLQPQLKLEKGQETKVAATLYAQISDEMKELQPPPPSQLDTPGEFGTLSEVAAASALLAVRANEHVVQTLAEDVIPLMRDKICAEHVTGVTVDVGGLQTYLSLSKVALISGRYDEQKAKKLILEEGVLSGVLPHGIDPLGYLDALTRFSPLAFTLPFHRANCAWHFQAAGMWGFPHQVANAYPTRFMISLDPLASDYAMLGLQGLKGMGEQNIWKFLRLMVDGINRLLSYLVDVRNFSDETGRVDFLRQIQAHTAVHLLFADLSAMNFSTESHHRINFAFAALDKFANLRVNLGEIGRAHV